MLLLLTLIPFVCALILFGYFFDRFSGREDTPEIVDAMQQMNYAQVIPFPEPPEESKSFAAGA